MVRLCQEDVACTEEVRFACRVRTTAADHTSKLGRTPGWLLKFNSQRTRKSAEVGVVSTKEQHARQGA